MTQPSQTFNDAYIANLVASRAGPALGVKPPPYASGRYYAPTFLQPDGVNNLTTTSTRLYYIPTYIWEAHTFAGFGIYNAGAGDTGETLRLGIYTDSAGKPGTLAAAGAEITLGGAAADNDGLVSFTPSYIGWYWLAAHFNSAASVRAGNAPGTRLSDVGYVASAPSFVSFIGALSPSAIQSGTWPACFYVDTVYGALASTPVAYTATTGTAPMVYLKG